MELRHAEYFVAVAEEANFTKAAARLRVAQPGISAQIRQLEQELGQALFDRSTRKVMLTEAGKALLPHFRRVLQSISDARAIAAEFSGLMRGHVAIGMVTGCSSIELADTLAAFHVKHPGVEIALSEANSDRLIESLQSGQLDLALVGLAAKTHPGIKTQIVTDEPIVAAVPAGDHLAQGNSIALRDIEGKTLNCLPRGTGIRDLFDNACIAAGFQPRIAFEATSLNILAQLSARGLGVAILPASSARAHKLHALRIVNPSLRGRIGVAWRASGQSTAAATVLISDARRAFSLRAAKGKIQHMPIPLPD